MRDYEDLKQALWKKREQVTKCDPTPEKEKGNLTFYLKKYPDVRIQITSKRYFLKLHGVKPNEFLLDLKVVRELVSQLGESYPDGIDFKLDKENYGYYDKDQIIEELKEQNDLIYQMFITAKKGRQEPYDFIDNIGKQIDENPVAHNQFAEGVNNFFAKLLCKNGFLCRPDGSLKANFGKDALLDIEGFPRLLLKSGFLDDY